MCVTAPWRLAFTDEDDIAWTVVGACVDVFFLVDLVINFFTAYHDDEFNLVDNRKVSFVPNPAENRLELLANMVHNRPRCDNSCVNYHEDWELQLVSSTSSFSQNLSST